MDNSKCYWNIQGITINNLRPKEKKTKKKLHNMVQDRFVLYLEILNNNCISIKGGKQAINHL